MQFSTLTATTLLSLLSTSTAAPTVKRAHSHLIIQPTVLNIFDVATGEIVLSNADTLPGSIFAGSAFRQGGVERSTQATFELPEWFGDASCDLRMPLGNFVVDESNVQGLGQFQLFTAFAPAEAIENAQLPLRRSNGRDSFVGAFQAVSEGNAFLIEGSNSVNMKAGVPMGFEFTARGEFSNVAWVQQNGFGPVMDCVHA